MPKKEKKEALKPGGAGVLVIDTAGKILLGKRSQTIENPGQWGLPGDRWSPVKDLLMRHCESFTKRPASKGNTE